MHNTIFRVAFIGVFCLLTFVSLWYKLRTAAFKDHVFNRQEGWQLVVLRWLFALPLGWACLDYIADLDSSPWMYLSVPVWLRVLGAAVALLAVLLLRRVHHELGRNFSTTLVIRNEHRLIRSGPYRYVRHPMYSAYCLLFIGTMLVSQNWLFGVSALVVIGSLMLLRIRREETLLLQRFGAEYLAYCKVTPAFLPLQMRSPPVSAAVPAAVKSALGAEEGD